MQIIVVQDKIGSGIEWRKFVGNLQHYYTLTNNLLVEVLDIDIMLDGMYYEHLAKLGEVERREVATIRGRYVNFLNESFGYDYIKLLINEVIAEKKLTGAAVLVIRCSAVYFTTGKKDIVTKLLPESSLDEGVKVSTLFNDMNKLGMFNALSRN